jgi:hypothetical protein
VAGFSPHEVDVLLKALRGIRDNIDPASTGSLAPGDDGDLS